MNIRIFEIIRESHKSLFTELSGVVYARAKWAKIIVFDVLPGIVSALFISNSNLVNKDKEVMQYLLMTCSIFAGLLFSLIIVIVDKAKKIKDKPRGNNEGEFYYVSRYLRFSKQLITKISFAIIIALIVIIFGILGEINFGLTFIPEGISKFKNHIISFIICYFSTQFFLLVIHIISEMYSVFLEEIK